MVSIKNRPAESASLLAGALAALIGPAVGLDSPEEVAALAVVLGAIPGIVTFLVEQIRRVRDQETA